MGLWHGDGGPIIGMQLENEFGHCGPGGDGGHGHILALKKIAVGCGMNPAYWTVTGWGWAWVPQDEVLPVFGGYPDAPWEGGHHRLAPTSTHAFSPLWEQIAGTTIGSDGVGRVAKEARLTFDPTRTPFATAELGAGNEARYNRRPVFSGADGAAVPLVKLGEGANLLGYYMYHGGTHGRGGRGTVGTAGAGGPPGNVRADPGRAPFAAPRAVGGVAGRL